MTHAWYSRTDHERMHTSPERFAFIHSFSGSGIESIIMSEKVQFVMINGKEVMATVISDDLDFGERYLWSDAVYLGEFDPAYQRTVRADSVPLVTK